MLGGTDKSQQPRVQNPDLVMPDRSDSESFSEPLVVFVGLVIGSLQDGPQVILVQDEGALTLGIACFKD